MIGAAFGFGFFRGLSAAWKYVVALVILALILFAVHSAYRWAFDNGADSRDPEVATLKGERDQAKARVTDVESANRVNVALVESLKRTNKALADGSREQQARAALEAETLKAEVARMAAALTRSQNERKKAYEVSSEARAWRDTGVPAAVDRSLRE